MRSIYYQVFDFIARQMIAFLKIFSLWPKDQIFNKELVRKILIIRIDRIGDLILSTPAIRSLKNEFPTAEIHLLVNAYAKDLVLDNPNVHKLIINGQEKIDKDYNLAIAFHPGFKQNQLAFKSNAQWRVGYAGWGGSFFLNHCLNDDRLKRPRHEVEFTLEAVKAVGGDSNDKRLEVSQSKEGEQFAERFFQGNGLKGLVIVIHPGARQAYVRWKKDGFAEVADRLIEKYNAKIILSGAKSEEALLNDISMSMRHEPILCVGLRLSELISVIKRCCFYLGNITGPMHIAAALNIPVIAITGMKGSLDDTRYWGPWCDDYEIVRYDTGCKQCYPGDCSTIECMQKITADEVFAAAEKMVKRYA